METQYWRERATMKIVTDQEFQSAVLKRFMDKYVKEGTGFRDEQGNRTLLGCSLKDNYYDDCVLIKTEDIPKLGLQNNLPIYVYFDGSEELFVTTYRGFCQYIKSLEEWEYNDTEVFDDTLEWLIYVTHDDTSMLVGFNEDE